MIYFQPELPLAFVSQYHFNRDTVNKLRDLKVSIVGASVGNTHLESQSGILIRKVNGVSIGFVAVSTSNYCLLCF